METETIVRYWCCDCIHYLHGQLNQPCAKGCSYVGYLNEGCHRWENAEGLKKPRITHKVCSVCGKTLPVSEFYRNKDNKDRLTKACKVCKPHWKTDPERVEQKAINKEKKEMLKYKSVIEMVGKPIVSVDDDGNVTNYPSARKAQDETGVVRSSISACCKGKRLSAGGLKWYYLEQWQEMNK